MFFLIVNCRIFRVGALIFLSLGSSNRHTILALPSRTQKKLEDKYSYCHIIPKIIFSCPAIKNPASLPPCCLPETILFSLHPIHLIHSLKDFILAVKKNYVRGKKKTVLSHNMYFQIFLSLSLTSF